jgi:hypothetical protein
MALFPEKNPFSSLEQTHQTAFPKESSFLGNESVRRINSVTFFTV